jgi:hypothetical protein
MREVFQDQLNGMEAMMFSFFLFIDDFIENCTPGSQSIIVKFFA